VAQTGTDVGDVNNALSVINTDPIRLGSAVDAFVAAWKHGRSLPDIAVEFGIHRCTVANHLKGCGVSRL